MNKKFRIPVIIVSLILLILLPQFISNNYFVILLNQTLISIIILVGLNFVTGLMGQMNLSTAGIMAMGAYTSALLCTKLGWSPWIAMIFVILVGFLLGVGLGYPSLRVKGIYLALTTLGFSEVVRLLANNMVSLTGGPTGVRNIPPFSILGYEIKGAIPYYYFLLVIVIAVLLFSRSIINSKWGRAIKAIRDNDLAVEACGIKISTIKIFAFTLGCIYGCVGGALYGHLIGYINPTNFSVDTSTNYLMMLMVGGIGSTTGNIIGAIIVTFMPELLRFLGNYYWLVFSIVILVSSIFLPKGIVSLPRIIKEKLKSRRAEGEV